MRTSLRGMRRRWCCDAWVQAPPRHSRMENLEMGAREKMVAKNILIAISASIVLAACTTPSTVLVTPEGKMVRCAAHGWGYIGAPLAQDIHDKCVGDVRYTGALPVEQAGSIGVMPSSEPSTVKVLKVAPGSPAELVGIKAGYIIVAVDGQPVGNWADARKMLFGRAGTQVKVTFSDGATEKTEALTRRSIGEATAAFQN